MTWFYESGPMTGIADFNFPLFDSLRDALVSAEHHVFSPADHDRQVIEGLWPGKRPEDFDGYAEGDIARYFDAVSSGGAFTLDNMMVWDLDVIVNRADAIILLPGWEQSSGCLSERYAAESIGLPIYLAWAGESAWAWKLDDQQQLLRPTLKALLAPKVSYEQAGR